MCFFSLLFVLEMIAMLVLCMCTIFASNKEYTSLKKKNNRKTRRKKRKKHVPCKPIFMIKFMLFRHNQPCCNYAHLLICSAPR